jgi:hypothetical protein
VKTALALITSLALGGCFYIDPINQRPSLDIKQDDVDPIFRGDTVSFTAVVVDPDDHGVDLTWHVYLCTDATTFADCDSESAFPGDKRSFSFTVPLTRLDGHRPVEGIRIVLDGVDDHGAAAKPPDQLQLPVLDRNPDLVLQKNSVYKQPNTQFVVGMPIDFSAVYGDGDDTLDSLAIDWTVFPPQNVTPDFTDAPIDSPPGKRQVAKILRPQVTGEWIVQAVVTDPAGNKMMRSETASVIPDAPPCIISPAPLVPGPTDPDLPVMDPTLFQVKVSDDLDSYPKSVNGAEYREATFVWTILAPGNPRTVIGTGPNVLFDPSVYAPMTHVELRVEIQDRKQIPVNCPAGDATCAAGGNTSCIQRQTWRVEAR